MAPSSSKIVAAPSGAGGAMLTTILPSLAVGAAAGYLAARIAAASSSSAASMPARAKRRCAPSTRRQAGATTDDDDSGDGAGGRAGAVVPRDGRAVAPVPKGSNDVIPSLESERTAMDKSEVLRLRRRHFCDAVSVSYSNSDPLMIVGGQGSRLIDSEGRTFLDTRNNVCHVGHQNPAIIKAVQTQVATLNTNTRYLHPNASLLASRLSSLLPDPLDVVFLVNSGSEANDLALRLARACTGSRNAIVVEGGYHGHTLACLEVSPYKYEHSGEFEDGSPGDHVRKVPRPDSFRGLHRGDDPEIAADKYASYVREACESLEARGEKGEGVGALIVEGGMSVAGVILPPPGYLRKCVDCVRTAGGLYIADEVQTGFGRLGTSFWAFQHGWDEEESIGEASGTEEDDNRVVPDIVTVGKPFGNGMPLAAVVTTRAVSEKFASMGVEYFNTFGGNPVCCAAGLAVLDEVVGRGLQEHAREVGAYMKERFWDLSRKLKRVDALVAIGDVRGSGLFLGVELIRNMETLEPASAETSFICSTLKEKYRVLTSIDGPDENVFVFKPPMVFSKEDADELLLSFENAIVQDLQNVNNVEQLSKTPT